MGFDLGRVTAAQLIAGGLLTAAGGLLGNVVGAFQRSRSEAAKEPADNKRALAEWESAVAEGGTELINEFRKEFKFLRLEQSEANKKITAQGAEIVALRAEVDDHRRTAEASLIREEKCERALEALREEIRVAVANAGVAPPYGPTLVNGLVPPRAE